MPADHPGGERRGIQVTGGDPTGDGTPYQLVGQRGRDTVTQPETAVAAIRYGFGLLPAVVMLAAVLLQRRYTLDGTARAAG